MTCAVSAAVRDGAKAVICASTGNTAASAAAYAARAGITCAVIVPDGQDRAGQDGADARPRRARDLAGGQLRPGARRSCASSPTTHPIVLVNSVNEFRIEGQKTAAFEIHEDARRGARSALHPGRQRRQHHLLLARLQGDGGGAAAVRLPGRGRRAARAAAIRSSTPKRSPARSASATPCAGRTRWPPTTESRGVDPRRQRRGDPRRLPAARLQGRDVLRARLRRLGRGPAQVRRRRRRARSCACSPAAA